MLQQCFFALFRVFGCTRPTYPTCAACDPSGVAKYLGGYFKVISLVRVKNVRHGLIYKEEYISPGLAFLTPSEKMADDACSSGNGYDGHLGARVSSIFVIGVISTIGTMFPLIARRSGRKVPGAIYLIARYFGSGVIVATAFIHLLAPAFQELGAAATCIGGGWAEYDWPPALAMCSTFGIFLIDLASSVYCEQKYGAADIHHPREPPSENQMQHHRSDIEIEANVPEASNDKIAFNISGDTDSIRCQRETKQQITSFLVLEFGIVFHSVIIGLNLGVAGNEFKTLYPVIVFHQTFEGVGLGARLSSIPFRAGSAYPWLLSIAYGLCTPVCIAIGLGARYSYNPNGVAANIVSGVLDSLSAGILLYIGLVELLAHDFVFNPNRTKNVKHLVLMVLTVLLGAGLMALLGKWA